MCSKIIYWLTKKNEKRVILVLTFIRLAMLNLELKTKRENIKFLIIVFSKIRKFGPHLGNEKRVFRMLFISLNSKKGI